MATQSPTQPAGLDLMDEVRRYLAAVDAFRAEGHEPRWLPEQSRVEGHAAPRRRLALQAPPIP